MKVSLYSRALHALEARILPDELYVKWFYYRQTGRSLNLDDPATFNEKLQWLKLNRIDPNLTAWVDKYEVKKKIANEIGSRYTLPTAKLFENCRDISFSEIPFPCVLKATHGSAWNYFLWNREDNDESVVRAYFRKRLKANYFTYSREFPYKKVKPRIICEALLLDGDGNIPSDFKVFCFNGKPKYISVDFDKFSRARRAVYDTDWTKQFFSMGYPPYDFEVPRPLCLEEILSVSTTLAHLYPFVRVDFLIHQGVPFIGEVTFFPGNGKDKFYPQEWDRKLGDQLVI